MTAESIGYENDFPKKFESDSDVSKNDISVPKPKLEVFPFVVFMLLGCVELLGWNTMLNGMYPMFVTVFGIGDRTVTCTAVYSTVLLAVTFSFVFFNVVKRLTLCIGIVLAGLLALGFGLVTQFSTAAAASPLYHFLAGLAAVEASLVGTAGFGYAAQFPVSYSSAMSSGLGLAGVLTFVLWMIGSYAVFDGTTSQGTRSSIWLLCSVTIALSIIAIVFQSILFRKLWVRAHFSKSSDVEEQHDVVKEGTYEREGLVGVLKRAVWVGVLQFLLFTVTLTLFPTFGPLAWYQAKSMDYDTAHVPRYFNAQRDSLIGVFQVCDFFSRYFPSIPFLNLNTRTAGIIVVSRFIFVVLFILSTKLTRTFLAQFWFLIIEQIIFTITNGWLSSVLYLRIFETVEGNEAKARVASFSLLCCFSGIAVGQWTGFGLRKAVIG